MKTEFISSLQKLIADHGGLSLDCINVKPLIQPTTRSCWLIGALKKTIMIKFIEIIDIIFFGGKIRQERLWKERRTSQLGEFAADELVFNKAKKISLETEQIPVVDKECFSPTNLAYVKWREQVLPTYRRELRVSADEILKVCEEVGYDLSRLTADRTDLIVSLSLFVENDFVIEQVDLLISTCKTLRTHYEEELGGYGTHRFDPRDMILLTAIKRVAHKEGFILVRRKLPEKVVCLPVPTWVKDQGQDPYSYSVWSEPMWESEAKQKLSEYIKTVD